MKVPHSRASGPPVARPPSSSLEVLLLVGTGLIGGSFALAARAQGLFDRVIGIDSNADALSTACSLGIVERPETSIEPTGVCIATPVSQIAEQVADAAKRYPGVPIFDVGSVKTMVVDSLRNDGAVPPHFVPCHPIAGSERVGARAARVDLFEGRSVIITPVEETDPETVATVESWWRRIGAAVTTHNPRTHDRIIAATSHLPHLVAFALMEVLEGLDEKAIGPYIGDGFRDLSRVAASDPTIWSDILQANRDATLGLAKQLGTRLVIDDNKAALRRRLAKARDLRARLDG